MDIQIFKENGWEIRTIEKDGEPWFVARDVVRCLGYEDAINAIKLHCKKVNKIKGGDLPPYVVDINIIPESDLYRLIMRSNLPKAEEFQDWVVEEVLPAIRKRGGYIMTSEKELQEDFDERVGKIVAAAMASKEKEILHYKKALALTTTSVDFRSFATKGGKEWTISDAADEFNMPMSELRVCLRAASFFRTRVMPGGQKRWWPKEKYFDSMYCKHVDGGINYAFSAKGMEWVAVLVEDGANDAMAKFELERQLELFD